MDPVVSVILPVYNGAAYLEAAVRSAFAQSIVHDDLEILAVDDGSTDTSLPILVRLAGEDARLKVFRQPNSGRAAARLRAAEEARGQWLALLDQDDLWDPEKTPVELAAARDVVQRGATRCDVVHSAARCIDPEGRVIGERLDEPPWTLAADATLKGLIMGNSVWTSTAIVRRDAYFACGGSDALNRFGTDDYELWLSLAASGSRFRFVDQVLASYRVHEAQASRLGARVRRGIEYALSRTYQQFTGAFGPEERQALEERLAALVREGA